MLQIIFHYFSSSFSQVCFIQCGVLASMDTAQPFKWYRTHFQSDNAREIRDCHISFHIVRAEMKLQGTDPVFAGLSLKLYFSFMCFFPQNIRRKCFFELEKTNCKILPLLQNNFTNTLYWLSKRKTALKIFHIFTSWFTFPSHLFAASDKPLVSINWFQFETERETDLEKLAKIDYFNWWIWHKIISLK